MSKGERLQQEKDSERKGREGTVSSETAEQKSSKASKESTTSKKIENEESLNRRPSEEGFFSDSKNIQIISIGNQEVPSKVKSVVNQAREKISQEKMTQKKNSEGKISEKEISQEKNSEKKINQEKNNEEKTSEKKIVQEKNNEEKISEKKINQEKNNKEKTSEKKIVQEKNNEEKVDGEKSTVKQTNDKVKNESTNQENPVPIGIIPSKEKEKKESKKEKQKKQEEKQNKGKVDKQKEKGIQTISFDNWQEVKGNYPKRGERIDSGPKEKQIQGLLSKNTLNKEKANKESTNKKPIDKKSKAKKNTEIKPIDIKPVDRKPIDKKPVDKKPTDKKLIDKKSIDKKPNDKKAIEKKSLAKKSPEKKPVAKKPAPPKKEPRKPMSKGAKMLLKLGIPATLLLGVYVAGSIFYSSQFIDRTFINGYEFSRTEPAVVSRFFEDKGDNFAIKISGIGGLEETITGEELGLSISDNGQVAALFESQSSWRWPIYFVTGADYEIDLLIDYNEALLEERVAEIVCVDREITVEPVDAKPVFNGERFEIQEEVLGTLIDPNIMMSHIQASMSAYGNSLDLYEVGAYIRPAIFSSNPNLIAAVDRLNHYVGASITYDLNPKQVVVNHEQIVDWLSWDSGFNVTFHEEMARGFIDEFIETYSTRGSTRSFTNPLGKTAQVESDFFGWLLDGETEVEAFLSNIRNGETVHREPAYFTRGSFHENGEWGDTYVQVCKTTQHLWYFVNGEFVLESPIVTGMAGSTQTPTGIFEILWMASPTVLRGPRDPETETYEWESPVSYWMAITWCGIGLHDATWQPYFGGNRWTYGGSRGCINMPLGQAGELYRMVGEGTMVIVHW